MSRTSLATRTHVAVTWDACALSVLESRVRLAFASAVEATMAGKMRVLKGFSLDAIQDIHKKIFERMGKENIYHVKPPITKAILENPDVLTSNAFERASDRMKIPAWRDGERGAVLQRKMVEDAADRFFVHRESDTKRALYASGSHWIAFSRLSSFMRASLVQDHGSEDTWPDVVKGKWREVMRGEHDQAIAKVSQATPSTFDDLPGQMMAHLKREVDVLQRIKQIVVDQNVLAASAMRAPEEPAPADASGSRGDECTPEEIQAALAGDADAASALPNYLNMNVAQKKQLVVDMNKRAKEHRAHALDDEFCRQAATVFRNRVVAFGSIEALKRHVDTSETPLMVRQSVVDMTMPESVQSGPDSKRVAREMSKEGQESLAGSMEKLRFTPIVGHVLVRNAQLETYFLETRMKKNFPHSRNVHVPVDILAKFQKFINSGRARSLGPTGDDKDGVSFRVRTIGHAPSKKPVEGDGDADSDDEAAGVEEMDAVTEACVQQAQEERPPEAQDETQPCIEAMTMTQLKATFGEEAPDLRAAFLQVGSRVTTPACFRPKSSLLQVARGERGGKKLYRKGQTDASVWIRALHSSLGCARVALGPGFARVFALARRHACKRAR